MIEDALVRQTAAEVTHWRLAIEALADLDAVAAPEAWASVETYLQASIRDRLRGVVATVALEAKRLESSVATGDDIKAVREGVLRVRRRYLQAETVLDFYGDAINSRTNPAMRRLLRGYDTLASDSMSSALSPLGIEAPPALVYVDKGLGASLLRAGIRLWDEAHPSPAAAIKLTRHNLSHPTALLHETGHQVGHLSGWNVELADVLRRTLEPRSRELAALWSSWASEVVGDVHAFAQAGWAPVVALANVVDGTTRSVYTMRIGDPHPFPWIRVMFNVALCQSWYGQGPWDRVGRAWTVRHPTELAGREVGSLAEMSVHALGDIVDVCTRRPMAAFRGTSLAAVLDPRRVSPNELTDLDRRAGASLLTSSYLRRRHSIPILSLLSTRAVLNPRNAASHRARLRTWVGDLGAEIRTAAQTPRRAA